MRRCVSIKVTGKVQKVFYRVFTQKQATKLEVEGTIQNLDDGAVLILACAVSDKLDDFIDVLYEGSDESKVENVIVEPLVKEHDFRGVFRVIGQR